MYQPEPSDTRTIILNDLLGNEIKLLLWGARAREFEAEDVRVASNEGALVAIFVGTLPKMSQGVKSLSGSSACRWYINEDLPEINAFHTRLGKDVAPLAVYTPIVQGIGASIREAPVEMTVKQLLSLDPFDNQRKPFFCKVTITRLGSDQRGSSHAMPAIRLPTLMALCSVAQGMVALPLRQNQHIQSAHSQLMAQQKLSLCSSRNLAEQQLANHF